MHPQEAYQMCANHMYRYVGVQMSDGSQFDGFIAEVNPDHVVIAVPSCDMMDSQGYGTRQFGFGFFPRRRFFRRVVPFRFFPRFFLLPFFFI